MGNSVWVMAKGFAPDEGGHQTYAEQIALAYLRRGADVTVFTQSSAGPRKCVHARLQLVDIGPGKGMSIPFRWISALRREKRRTGGWPDFIHATTWRTAIPPMLLGRKMAVTFHGREFMYVKGLAFRAMAMVAQKACPPVAVSQYSAMRLKERLGTLAPAIVVAWNGTSITPLADNRAPAKAPLIFSLCRLEPRKNILAAVLAAISLAQKGKAFRYIVCGRGPELEAIRDIVHSNKMQGCIDIAGFVDNATALELYSKADIFVHPQVVTDNGRDFEGFGIAIADAMLAGCAVVVGRDGGAAELAINDQSGLIVDGHSVKEIERAIERLLDNAEERSAIAENGRQRAQSLMNWDAHAGTILQQSRLNF